MDGTSSHVPYSALPLHAPTHTCITAAHQPSSLLTSLALHIPVLSLSLQTPHRGNNEEFLSRATKYAERKKWSHLLSAFHTGLSKVALDEDAAAAADKDGTAAGDDAAAGAAASAIAADMDVDEAGRVGSHKQASTSAPAALGSTQGKGRRGRGGSGGSGSRPAKRQKVVPRLAEGAAAEWRTFAAQLEVAERAAAVAEGGCKATRQWLAVAVHRDCCVLCAFGQVYNCG